ncbi:ABC transporter ATP-binding protein [Mucilaginibacter hurinus]|uniref:ABC transporter ATP-binding protein n=1 Tax=Mucilaginibacter hurinus TaxID=2201324 RepID=A0A367GV06_9SPHI|nr:ABC transporter ATP-binding protein [Mucilaginibacter hurinus]RCH56656.1 ABC transporter ATP-binding protein [Mucilaginibacter hurinus]
MLIEFKNNFRGYFTFYYKIIGNRIFAYLVLSILVSLLDGIGLAMFMPLFSAMSKDDSVSADDSTMGGLQFITDGIQALGISLNITTVLCVLGLLFTFKGVCKFIQLNFQVDLRYQFIRTVRTLLIENLTKLSYPGFLKLESGRVHNTLTSEVTKVFTSMNFYFLALQNAVMLLTYIGLAFLANAQFAILVAIGGVLSNLLYKKIYTATKQISIKLSANGVKFTSYMIQAIHNFKYLKSTNYFSRYSEKLKDVMHENEVLNKRVGFYNAISLSAKEPMIMIIVAGVIQIQISVIGTSLGAILLSLMFFYRALNFLVIIQNNWQSFVQNTGGMMSVTSTLNDMYDMREEITDVPPPTIQRALKIKDVDFSYGETKILDKINLEMPRNQTIALVGESGSGKTTLANLISGLISPDRGEITIDQVPLNNYDLNAFRSRIGYISQDAVVFNDSIYNNITFWAEPSEENKKRFWEVVELTSLTSFISTQPEKEQTRLGNNGILISGGQKQRISIARELYKKAEILILDEATSALDSETEKIIQENIEKLHGTYTMVIIAHRLSTIKNADIIYLLEKGKVTASGSFDTMLEVSERFKRMVNLQEI